MEERERKKTSNSGAPACNPSPPAIPHFLDLPQGAAAMLVGRPPLDRRPVLHLLKNVSYYSYKFNL
jgi:hypothetical protein